MRLKEGENTVEQLSNEYYRKILFKTPHSRLKSPASFQSSVPLPSQIQAPLALRMAPDILETHCVTPTGPFYLHHLSGLRP